MFIKKGILFIILLFGLVTPSFAAPCYGTRMPKKGVLFGGVQTHAIFKTYLEKEYGDLRSWQNFFLLSHGIFDWLSIDLKVGTGYIKQKPEGSDEVDYPGAFSGGYGFRIKLHEGDRTRVVFGFQHISVHPGKIHLEDTKNTAVLDDWQYSLLTSYQISNWSPYLGAKWSRVDYIHWVGEDRKRKKSDRTKSVGAVLGCDFPLNEEAWVNLEGQFFDGKSLAVSFNFAF